MAGDPYQRVTSGTPFAPSAGVWNDFLDTTKEFKAKRFGQGGISPHLDDPTSIKVRVYNGTGEDLDRCSVLGIGGPLFEPIENDPQTEHILDDFVTLVGEKPTADHAGSFVITSGPIKAGAIGRAILEGVSWCEIAVETESHQYADLVAGSYLLGSGDSGSARILWKQPGAGNKWGIVRFGQTAQGWGFFQGVLLEDFTADDSTVTCDHVHPTDGGPSCLDNPEDEAEVVELHNPTGFAGDAGNLVKFYYNRHTKQKEIFDTACSEDP